MCRGKRWLAAVAALALTAALGTSAMAAGTEPRQLVPVGRAVGVKLFSRGVVVSGMAEGETPARSCGLRAGDVIVSCDGEEVTSSEQFRQLLQQEDARLTVQRERRELDMRVEPEKNPQGVYCIGAWVRDSMAGIGTMTYYDPGSGDFGALGHGITDVDTAVLMPFGDGSILPARVKAVQKGEAGRAGELRGDFDLTACLGSLSANTTGGIFGKLKGIRPLGKPLPIGRPAVGPAQILTNVEGNRVALYDVEIIKTMSGKERNLILVVRDPALLKKTGGIVQGMSGSPIIQGRKLVGAVTHVFLHDPKKGYGISIGNMLKAAI